MANVLSGFWVACVGGCAPAAVHAKLGLLTGALLGVILRLGPRRIEPDVWL